MVGSYILVKRIQAPGKRCWGMIHADSPAFDAIVWNYIWGFKQIYGIPTKNLCFKIIIEMRKKCAIM